MENQEHLLNTIGPMYIEAQTAKAAAEAAQAVAPEAAPPAA
jgi:hypothetical protein